MAKKKTKEDQYDQQEVPKTKGPNMEFSGHSENLRRKYNTPWPGQSFIPSKLTSH